MYNRLVERGPRPRARGMVEVVIKPPAEPAVAQYFRKTHMSDIDPPWTTLPEIPTTHELRSSGHEPGEQILTPNVRYGAWKDKDTYLAGQYAFLREEAIRQLRDAVSQVRNVPNADEDTFSQSAVGIYDGVHIIGWLASTRGIAMRITFSTRRAGKKILWTQAKRLMTGSLVALTPSDDMFQTKLVLATVAARPLDGLNLNPPELELFFARAEEVEIDPAVEWTMVEARSAFFEAQRHTMLAIQKLADEPFPLSKHIVSVDAIVQPPPHIATAPVKDLTAIFGEDPEYHDVDVLTAWPRSLKTSLDTSQQQAVQRIFTSALAIIQGPPGTGKTFVSVKAIRALLANMVPDAPPIIVTAQTNHALDQILRHIAEFEPNFARLGGRSKDKDIVLQRTLFNLRQEKGERERVPGSLMRRARNEMRRIERRVAELLEPLLSSSEALDPQLLMKHDLLSAHQVATLQAGASKWHQAGVKDLAESHSPLILWAKQSMVKVPFKPQPENFGFAYEEEELEFEDLQDVEAENVIKDDDFVDALSGSTYTLADNFTCRTIHQVKDRVVQRILDETQDLWAVSEGHRGAVYKYLQNQLKKVLLQRFKALLALYTQASHDHRIGQWEYDEVVLRKQRVVGCTTTGLSKYRGLIAALGPKIVLVEEAGELVEAPVVAACMPTLEQLILVGDDKQLRPHCTVREHEQKPLRYNLSLFERLVKNNLGLSTLNTQRRMTPEIRRLLRPIYADVIQDHDSVKDKTHRPDVPGMGGINSWFFTHQWPESHDDLNSCINEDEAAMVIGLAAYLVRNGMSSQHVTILTFYNGQRKKILQLMRRSTSLRDEPCPVVTVDSYQGEENKVVILSLVRSNRSDSIGFLANKHRVCVALSRAQQGFYILGNAMLLSKYKLWMKVLKIISGKDIEHEEEIPPHEGRRIHELLPVTCEKHGVTTEIRAPSDWIGLSGGCRKACDWIHDCGHTCILLCHPGDHVLLGCAMPCDRTLDCGHHCSMACGQACICVNCSEAEAVARLLRETQETSVSSSDSADWRECIKQEHLRQAELCQPPLRPPAAAELSTSSAKPTGSALKEELLIEL